MAVIKLKIYVGNLANVMGLFDQIQVHRSEVGEAGPYAEITGPADAAATVLGSVAAPFTLNSKTLKLKVDGGAEQTITFVTADPINADDAVDFLNGELAGAVAAEEVGAIRLISSTLGTGSFLEITGGTALADLGFTLGYKDNGEDERILLMAGQADYEYDDQSGDADFYYQTRYYNSGTGAVSSFSDPIQGDIGSVIGASYLIKGVLDLATLDGAPVADRRVTFHPVYVPSALVVDDVGVVRGGIEVYTDPAGHAEVMLIRGATVDVTIAGTGITRQITVPSAGTEFDVLGEVAAADDVFQIQIPDIPAAVRRT